MNSQQLLEHSSKVKRHATELLQTTNIQKILENYGNVHLVGSYPLDIMYGPDIDIVVETKNTKEDSMKALREIVEKNLVRKVEYGDFVHFPLKNRPHGYIIVLRAEVEGKKWEIEIWFLEDSSEQLGYMQKLKTKLTEEKRIEILEAKHNRAVSSTSKHDVSSYQIYEEILEMK